jgi:CO/xanthine dehydrogenase Mo-binding subunit
MPAVIDPISIETPDPNGPFGAKGIGESALIPVAPAIANAIYDACGARIKDLPIKAEKIFLALAEQGS